MSTRTDTSGPKCSTPSAVQGSVTTRSSATETRCLATSKAPTPRPQPDTSPNKRSPDAGRTLCQNCSSNASPIAARRLLKRSFGSTESPAQLWDWFLELGLKAREIEWVGLDVHFAQRKIRF